MLEKDYTSDYNNAIGAYCMENNSGGSNNVAIGYEALEENTTGNNNTTVGHRSSDAITTGTYNTAIGSEALGKNTTGDYNVCIGANAGNQVIGTGNCFGGFYAGKDSDTGNYNTAFGHYAFCSNQNGTTDGEYNSAFGRNALQIVSTGDYNSAIGDGAGIYITSGSNNTMLGRGSGGNGAPSGNVSTASNIVCIGNNSVTDLYCADTSISSSDSRDKADVTNFTHGMDWVKQLRPVTYKWDKRSWYSEDLSVTPDGQHKKSKKHIGFLAQEVLAVEGNPTDKDDMLVVNLNCDDSAYGLKYERLVPVLVNALNELSTKIDTLETENTALKARVTTLEGG